MRWLRERISLEVVDRGGKIVALVLVLGKG